METFKPGKTYLLNTSNNYTITVLKRTAQFLTFRYFGNVYRKKIYKNNLFKLGENILIPTGYGDFKYFCFAHFETEK